MEQNRKTILYCDIIIGVAFAMMLAVRILSVSYFSAIATETKAEIEQIHQLYEANPVAKLSFNFAQIGYVLEMGILPALGIATYLYFRRKAVKGQFNLDLLEFFVNYFFFMMICNMANDGAALFGRLI